MRSFFEHPQAMKKRPRDAMSEVKRGRSRASWWAICS